MTARPVNEDWIVPERLAKEQTTPRMARKKTNGVSSEASSSIETTRKRLSDDSDHEHETKRQRSELVERTDYSRWRMRDDHGRHTWQYLEDDEAAKDWPQSYADKYYLGLPLVSTGTGHRHENGHGD